MKDSIPSDVSAYITRSALDIIKDADLRFQSKDQFDIWLRSNLVEVVEGARSKMNRMLSSVMEDDDIRSRVVTSILRSVYYS